MISGIPGYIEPLRTLALWHLDPVGVVWKRFGRVELSNLYLTAAEQELERQTFALTGALPSEIC